MKRILVALALVILVLPAVAAAQGENDSRVINLKLRDAPLSQALAYALPDGDTPVLQDEEQDEPRLSLWVYGVPADRYMRVLTEAVALRPADNPKGDGNSRGRVLPLEELEGFNRLIVDGRNVLAEAWTKAGQRLQGNDERMREFYDHRRRVAQMGEDYSTNGGNGYLGVRLIGKGARNLDDLDPWVRETLGDWDGYGAFIREIVADTGAAVSGLQPGDVVLRINEFWIDSSCTLMRLVARTKPGEEIQLEVLREGEILLEWAEITAKPQSGTQSAR